MLKYVYKNVNPKGKETADCVTRALVLATGMSYEDVVSLQVKYSLEIGESFANKLVYEKILKRHGYVKYKQPKREDGTMYCIKEMDEILTDDQLAFGVFVAINSHVSFIKGKNYYDIWDCGDCCVRNFYVKEQKATVESESPVTTILETIDADIKTDKHENILGVRYNYEKIPVKTAEEFIELVTENNYNVGSVVLPENEREKAFALVQSKLPEKEKSIFTYLYAYMKMCWFCDEGVYNEIIDDIIEMANSDFLMAQNMLGNCYYNGQGVEQSYEKAVIWYKKAAEQGNANAQCSLGYCYDEGQGVKLSHEKAVYWFQKAAEQGYASAQCNLGVCYDNGQGVEQSYEQAAYWYKKSAEQGDSDAQFSLAVCYENGEGVEQSYEKAVYWYKKSAEQGDSDAQYNLALCYENGKGVEQSAEKAVYWVEKAAEQGDSDAQFSLAVCYENGNGVKQSDEKAVEWLIKAAEQGDSDAQYNLGVHYYNGEGVKLSFEIAAEWFKKSAEQDNSEAEKMLAILYKEGSGVVQSDEKASYWMEKSAKHGNADAKEMLTSSSMYDINLIKKSAEEGNADAQFSFAVCFEQGDGIEQSFEKAAYWYQKSADQGDARAQCCLAICYASGKGVKRSDEKAVYWYKKAAEHGDAIAQYNLGTYYYEGYCVKKSYAKAVELFKKSANQGYSNAQFNLGLCYQQGVGTTQSYKDAVYWYKKSAEQGDASAQYNLGVCYYNGQGVEQSYEQAVIWYKKAAEQGDEYAIEALKKLGIKIKNPNRRQDRSDKKYDRPITKKSKMVYHYKISVGCGVFYIILLLCALVGVLFLVKNGLLENATKWLWDPQHKISVHTWAHWWYLGSDPNDYSWTLSSGLSTTPISLIVQVVAGLAECLWWLFTAILWLASWAILGGLGCILYGLPGIICFFAIGTIVNMLENTKKRAKGLIISVVFILIFIGGAVYAYLQLFNL